MEPETIVIITGEHSSCLKETKFGGDPATECVSVHVGHPESVYVMNGRRTLYTESDMKAERQAGQNEAWELAQKILRRPESGGYTIDDLRRAFDITEVVPDRTVPDVCILQESFDTALTGLRKVEEKKAKEFHPGDVVTLEWGGGIHKAVVTLVMPNLLSVVFDTGDIDNVGKSRCSKTGKTLNVASLLVELNGEEE